MPSDSDIKAKFWKALKSDRTFMLGLPDAEGDSQPMTAIIEDEDTDGPIWVFTSNETDLAHAIGAGHDATAQFASKGHDLFAALQGPIAPENDRETIDRLWNPFVAAWFTGKDDPKLLLLRFDPERAHIWLNENSLFAGVKLLFGKDPKKEYADKVAEVRLD